MEGRKLLAVPVFLATMYSMQMKELPRLMPFELAHHHLMRPYFHPGSS
jgi:hypothetical protein